MPARDLAGFVAQAKARTDLFYGSTGPGSTMNLVGEILKRDAGIRMEHVPFRGAAPLVQDMLAGRIHFGGDQLPSSVGHIRNGALRPLAYEDAEHVLEQDLLDLERLLVTGQRRAPQHREA